MVVRVGTQGREGYTMVGTVSLATQVGYGKIMVVRYPG